MRSFVAAWLFLPLIVLVTGSSSEAKEATTWTQSLADKHLAAVCDAVEQECGATFRKRPTVTISTTSTIREILAREVVDIPETIIPKSGRDAFARIFSEVVLGKYEIDKHVIHIVPANLAAMREAMPSIPAMAEPELRVLLAHEATHALDFERFDLGAQRRSAVTQDTFRCLGAVIEGHAEWVSKRIAATWGIPKAYEQLDSVQHAEDSLASELEQALMRVVRAELNFAYVQGRRFFEAVFAAQGRAAVERAMRTPPTSVRQIEQPKTWLHPEENVSTVDTRALVRRFAGLFDPDLWKTMSTALLIAHLEAMKSMMPAEHQADLVKGFVEGSVLVARRPLANQQVVATVIAFETEADAKRFTDANLGKIASSEGQTHGFVVKTLARTDGAGTGNRLPGAWLRRTVKAKGNETTLEIQVFRQGTVTYDLTVVNTPAFGRAVQDTFIDYALATDAARADMTPPTPPALVRKLRIRVQDSNGAKVLNVRMVHSYDDDRHRTYGRTEGGEITIPLKARSGTLTVYGAQDPQGNPRPLGPKQVRFDAADTDLVVVLPKHAPLTGTIRNQAGEPVANVQLEARTNYRGRPNMMMMLTHGKATTNAQGQYTFVGLGPWHYDIEMKRNKTQVRAAKPIEVSVPEGGSTRDITLVETQSYVLTLLDPQGKPVSMAQVGATQIGRSRVAVYTSSNAKGQVTLEGLRAGMQYDLRITPGDHQPNLAYQDVRAWKPAATTITLAKGWSLRGTLVDANDEPTQGRVVYRRGTSTRYSPTGRDGRFVVAHLPQSEAVEICGLMPETDGQGGPRATLQSINATDQPVRIVITED